MGTKNNPGKFDCHEAAEPDEPRFTVIGRDQLAPFLVLMWAHMRNEDPIAVYNTCNRMIQTHMTTYDSTQEREKVEEALDCSNAMTRWSEANRP